jgi:hypothetical protein
MSLHSRFMLHADMIVLSSGRIPGRLYSSLTHEEWCQQSRRPKSFIICCCDDYMCTCNRIMMVYEWMRYVPQHVIRSPSHRKHNPFRSIHQDVRIESMASMNSIDCVHTVPYRTSTDRTAPDRAGNPAVAVLG